MVFGAFFKQSESLVGVDIGSTAIKLVEFDVGSATPKLLTLGSIGLSSDPFGNNVVQKQDYVSEQITSLFESNSLADKRVVTSVPGPSVFTKRTKMPDQSLEELRGNIELEAANLIPHNIRAVKIDFDVLGPNGKNLDILVVAVKNEVLDSFVDSFAMSGFETAIVDVDYFAVQNIFETAYPEEAENTCALIHVGARFSTVNICRGGQSLFTGDISVGGNQLTEFLAQDMEIEPEAAEEMKRKASNGDESVDSRVGDIIAQGIEIAAGEISRQLSFFWNSSAEGAPIDRIYLTGGASQAKGLKEELSEKAGIPSEYLDPFKNIEFDDEFDEAYLKELRPVIAIAAGLGLRQVGDKEKS